MPMALSLPLMLVGCWVGMYIPSRLGRLAGVFTVQSLQLQFGGALGALGCR